MLGISYAVSVYDIVSTELFTLYLAYGSIFKANICAWLLVFTISGCNWWPCEGKFLHFPPDISRR